jgi:hypothetical protein
MAFSCIKSSGGINDTFLQQNHFSLPSSVLQPVKPLIPPQNPHSVDTFFNGHTYTKPSTFLLSCLV